MQTGLSHLLGTCEVRRLRVRLGDASCEERVGEQPRPPDHCSGR